MDVSPSVSDSRGSRVVHWSFPEQQPYVTVSLDANVSGNVGGKHLF